MEELKKIINEIYVELQIKNHDLNVYSIPEANIFTRDMSKKFNLIPECIIEIMNILERSDKIFIINIVNEDSDRNISSVDGYVVTEGNTIQKLCKAFENELSRLYIIEFNKKQNTESIIRDILPQMDEYNNTSIGKSVNIIYSLERASFELEKNILRFSKIKQEKKLEEELQKIGSFAGFLNKFVDEKLKEEEHKKHIELENSVLEEKAKKILTKPQAHLEIEKKHSIDKTLAVYGIEFYSHVCFRDYQFSLIKKLIDDKHITTKNDLLIVKKQLQRARQEADKDIKLQEYAAEINDLERCINRALKAL